jgi:hypothetical protein
MIHGRRYAWWAPWFFWVRSSPGGELATAAICLASRHASRSRQERRAFLRTYKSITRCSPEAQKSMNENAPGATK